MSEYIKKADMEKILYSTNNAVRIGELFTELPTYTFPDSAENKREWIPIENGYPEELKADDGYVYPSDYVLTFDSHGMYGTSRYWGNRTSKRERPDDYLDWMDLPLRIRL